MKLVYFMPLHIYVCQICVEAILHWQYASIRHPSRQPLYILCLWPFVHSSLLDYADHGVPGERRLTQLS